MRAALLPIFVIVLTLLPPVSSELLSGLSPSPPAAAQGTGGEASPRMPDVELWKFALTQGGLTVVCLVLFWYIQRDATRKAKEADEVKVILVGLVEKNTTALVQSQQTNARIARALEGLRVLPPGTGV
jgi:hypothetical protein